MSQDRNQTICDLYAQGKKGRAIAPIVGMSYQGVYYVLKRRGVLRTHTQRPKLEPRQPRPFSPPPPRVRAIVQEIAGRVGATVQELVAGESRRQDKRHLIPARDEAMARCYDLMRGDQPAFSHTRIGQMFGDRTASATTKAIARHRARVAAMQEAA